MLPPPPRSTLFPYTTLFRSLLSGPSFRAELFGSPVVEGLGGLSTTDLEAIRNRSEEHTSELQSPYDIVCRLLLEKKKKKDNNRPTDPRTVSTSFDRSRDSPL